MLLTIFSCDLFLNDTINKLQRIKCAESPLENISNVLLASPFASKRGYSGPYSPTCNNTSKPKIVLDAFWLEQIWKWVGKPIKSFGSGEGEKEPSEPWLWAWAALGAVHLSWLQSHETTAEITRTGALFSSCITWIRYLETGQTLHFQQSKEIPLSSSHLQHNH